MQVDAEALVRRGEKSRGLRCHRARHRPVGKFEEIDFAALAAAVAANSRPMNPAPMTMIFCASSQSRKRARLLHGP